MWAATLPAEDLPWHRRNPEVKNVGAFAKSGPSDALAAASAKQAAALLPSSLSKSPAPWRRSAPLPAPPKAPPGAPGATSVAKSSSVAGPSTLSEFRSRLVAIYSIHNPSNVAKVDYLLDKYKGREELLYTSVRKKYQIPESWDGHSPLRKETEESTNQSASGSPVGLSEVAPWEVLKASSRASEGQGMEAKKEEAKAAEEAEAVAEPKEAAPAAGKEDKPEELEAMSEALAALQTLVEDISDDRSVPSKPLKPAADVPSAKGMARIDYFLVGEKTDFFSDEETMVEDLVNIFKDEMSDLDSEEEAEPPEEEEEPPAPSPGPSPGPSPDAEAAEPEPAARVRRRPPTPPKPRRKLPKPQEEADAAPADPRRRPLSDDDEVVVVSVDGAPEPGEEDAELGAQMRQALGASLGMASEPLQMALPVVPMMEPGNEEAPGEVDDAEREPPAPPAPVPKAPAQEAVDAKRLAAAAAAARGARGLQASSGSDSDSEYSSMSSDEDSEGEPLMALPVPTGPEANGNGPKTTDLTHTEDKEVRQKLLGQIFEQLSDFCGTPKRSTVKGMQRFVTMVGFEGSDNEWQAEYKSLCKEWKVEPSKGFTQEAFNKMVDDQSPKGCYCTNEELARIRDKILATPRIPKASKVRKQPPSPPDPPPKKQKVMEEVQFQ